MQPPREKPFDPAVPPQFIAAVRDRLRRYDGRRIGEPRPCPGCGGTDHRKNGSQSAGKTFARLVTEEGFEDICFAVQQYECKPCSRTFQGDLSEHFYEGCAYGKPIVDLCLFHAEGNPYLTVERVLRRRYGLQVDRDTVERYDERFGNQPPDRADGVVVDGVRFSLSFLAFLFGKSFDGGSPFAVSSHRALW
jgi:hypothetical protein